MSFNSRRGYTIGPGKWCGTAGGYSNHDCRCDACTDAFAAQHLRYMHNNPEQRQKNREREARKRGGYKVGPRGDRIEYPR